MPTVDDPRNRIVDATVVCLGRYGIGKTTVEDAAREAGVSRATFYRYFPGGRDELISVTLASEVERFFVRLARAVEEIDDVTTRIERGLMFAHRGVEEHALLQKVLETEPERFLPHLTRVAPMVTAVLRAYLRPLLADEPLRAGMNPDRAADWLSRMILSFITAQGRWDLSDPAAVHRLVRDQLLAGVLAGPTSGSHASPLPPEPVGAAGRPAAAG